MDSVPADYYCFLTVGVGPHSNIHTHESTSSSAS